MVGSVAEEIVGTYVRFMNEWLKPSIYMHIYVTS